MKKSINLGLLGYGTVGQGLKKILDERSAKLVEDLGLDITIKRVLVRNIDSPRQVPIARDLFTTDVEDILNDEDIDIVVELMGGDTYDILARAFGAKKDVVTANKAVVSKYFEPLHELASENGCKFYYEASVGGGIPIIKPLYDIARINAISEVSGILNGTSNFILTHMTKDQRDYSDVLKEAQELGYAEADPYDDVEGVDALRKLRILSSIAFGADIREEDIARLGISKITSLDIEKLAAKNKVIKLICDSRLEDGRLTIAVLPTAVDMGSYYSVVNEAKNSISVYGDMIGSVRFYGPGAGMEPTANAVLTDIIDIGTDSFLYDSKNLDKAVTIADDFESVFYVRTSEDMSHIASEDLGDGAYITKEISYSEIRDLADEDTIVRIHGDNI